MFASFSEFKFYQSFRIPVEEADDLRFLVQMVDSEKSNKAEYIEDAKLMDISLTGLGLATRSRISVGKEISISLQFRKFHLDLTGKIVRAFSKEVEDHTIIYGVEIEEEKGVSKFLEQYILSFSADRLKQCLIDSALKERYTKATDGFEVFSLLLSLFKDITHFGDKEGFIESMLEEVIRILNAQRASLFLINPESNELEAVAALGMKKEDLRFDYRLGVAGAVFTTGVALNIDTLNDSNRFNEAFDKKFGHETRSIICHPIHNREDKIVGVIEVLNKRNEDRFTIEDEKTMKVLALIFSSVFYNFTPMSSKSTIRRFSGPFDRKNAFIGRVPHVGALRNTILKLKDNDIPVLVFGERGVGKALFCKIIHVEGQRGLKNYEIINCQDKDVEKLEREMFGGPEEKGAMLKVQGGSIGLDEISALPKNMQIRLREILKNKIIPQTNQVVDFRILATTSRDLGLLSINGEFDSELYEILSKASVYIEPLRRRMDDIPLLIDYFLKMECKKQGYLIKSFAVKLIDKFKRYDWPGNVRELKIAVERAVLYNPKAHVITDLDLENSAAPIVDVSEKKRMFGDIPHVTDVGISLPDRMTIIERELIFAELKRCQGNKSKAAKAMGISRESIRKKLASSAEVLKSLNLPEEEKMRLKKEEEDFESAA